jgi:hypothetical protein
LEGWCARKKIQRPWRGKPSLLQGARKDNRVALASRSDYRQVSIYAVGNGEPPPQEFWMPRLTKLVFDGIQASNQALAHTERGRAAIFFILA